MPGPDPRKARLMQGPKSGVGKMSPKEKNKKGIDTFIVIDDTFMKKPDMEKIIITGPEEKKAKGGRVGLKSGSKGCKLAMKGKGRAYGKNS